MYWSDLCTPYRVATWSPLKPLRSALMREARENKPLDLPALLSGALLDLQAPPNSPSCAPGIFTLSLLRRVWGLPGCMNCSVFRSLQKGIPDPPDVNV